MGRQAQTSRSWIVPRSLQSLLLLLILGSDPLTPQRAHAASHWSKAAVQENKSGGMHAPGKGMHVNKGMHIRAPSAQLPIGPQLSPPPAGLGRYPPKGHPPPPRVAVPLPKGTAWATSQFNNKRTSANPFERKLTPPRVASPRFGLIAKAAGLDGQVYAQPLYVPGVNVPGHGVLNLAFVATEGNSVYAFDTDKGLKVVWRRKLGIPIPSTVIDCMDTSPQYGITSTPVIDVATRTLYTIANTLEKGVNTYRLYAIDLATGDFKFGNRSTPIRPTSHGIVFDAKAHHQRPGLALYNGTIYSAWGSHCDRLIYHGWVLGHHPVTLRLTKTYITTPGKTDTGAQGAIWMGGAAPAISNGHMYIAVANGYFDEGVSTGKHQNFGQSVVKLNIQGKALNVTDFFTPTNYNKGPLSGDGDFGAGGLVIVSAARQEFIVQAGKSPLLYFLRTAALGGWCGPLKCGATPDAHAYQTVTLGGFVAFSSAATWTSVNGKTYVYFQNGGNGLMQFEFVAGKLVLRNKQTNVDAAPFFGMTPTVTSNGGSAGIVWEVGKGAGNKPILQAYDAITLQLLFDSEVLEKNRLGRGFGEFSGVYAKMNGVSVADGKVFVPVFYDSDPQQSQGGLAMFGLT